MVLLRGFHREAAAQPGPTEPWVGGGAKAVRRFMEGTAMQRPVAGESADLRSRQELERRVAGRTGLRRELAQTSEPRRLRAMSWEPWEGLKQELMDRPEK